MAETDVVDYNNLTREEALALMKKYSYPKPQITNMPPEVGIEVFRQIRNSEPVPEEELRKKSEKIRKRILKNQGEYCNND